MDDAAKALEENVVSLSVMKSTKYIQPFQKTVDTWERTLSYISEVMEMVLNVQRQYLYMEVSYNGLYLKSYQIVLFGREELRETFGGRWLIQTFDCSRAAEKR